MKKQVLILIILNVFIFNNLISQENTNQNKFKQLGQELPTPNVYRNAAGAPGHQYWQQQADYVIDLELDDETQKILGEETITYHNNSPDALEYLWVQLDQNVRAKDADKYSTRTSKIDDKKLSLKTLKKEIKTFDGGFKIDHVKDQQGNALPYTINKTMMRIDLANNLKPGEQFVFNIKYWYNINDRFDGNGGRSGYEYFKEDDNYLYTIAQFFPRMAVYNEVEGWQNKQFLGGGEFALVFGDYTVNITLPSDLVVASTGVLQNPKEVLTQKQIELLEKSKTASRPVMIINQSEAEKNERSRSSKKSTWTFKAENVRDFGFAASRKFIWDAMGVQFGERTVMAMSYYPKEGNPLWEKYSTEAVAHTLRSYSKYTFDYPYPVAISVHARWIGMEYPMICFNFGRPEKDGTYTLRTKNGMISVIIHEVGHNYFPMIVNSDERQWTWMDEGLNSFLQHLAEQEWDRDYPSRRGPPAKIVDYMKGDKSNISPIMTNSESIHQFGNNAYGKPATALNILRETVIGRELFDYAFKKYSQRWMFKHPSPADLFRTLEDASSVDLDWFWRGWFYTNDHVDIALDNVRWFQVGNQDPSIVKPQKELEAKAAPRPHYDIANDKDIPRTVLEERPDLKDFYNTNYKFAVNNLDKQEYQNYYNSLSAEDKAFLNKGYNLYEITFKNIGGLVMPLILEFEYIDGSKEERRIPAEIWRKNHDKVQKVFITEKEVKQITFDPYLELADTDTSNNYWPPKSTPSRFELFKQKSMGENPMQRSNRASGTQKRK